MKINFAKASFIGLALAACVGLSSCATNKPVADKKVTTSFKPGVPGGSLVESYELEATLIGKKPVARQMTFRAADGSTNTFTAGPGFKNYDAYQIGDRLKVNMIRELAAWFAPDAPPPSPDLSKLAHDQADTIAGTLTAAPTEFSAVVMSVNAAKQEVTLGLSDGRTATFHVRKDIDVNTIKPGITGTIRISAALAIMIQKR